jgi:hypothetical protein
LEDKYLKRLDLIWHYLKEDTFKSHMQKLISSTNSYHQSYCSMVTKVLDARLRIQTVEEVKENTVKPYILDYLESAGLKEKFQNL